MQVKSTEQGFRLHCTNDTAIPARWDRLKAFVRCEDGAMSYVAVVMSMGMLMVGGLAIDMMMSEMKRAKVQNTLDRAILAAADLDQELDPTSVVQDYFAKSGLGDYLGDVSVSEGLNYRTVGADATITEPSNFLKLVGVDTLTSYAAGVAEERVNKVEISLVLDISGSMENDNKMNLMKNAAREFVDSVVNADTQDLISVSLVPYSEHVNAGPDIFNQLNMNQRHEYSHCVEFPDNQFSSVALNTSLTYEQAQHFQWNYSSSNSRDDTVCPRYSYERITPFSQNAAALKSQINSLQPRAGTSIFMGMKWGAALLDPSTRFLTTGSDSNVDAAFDGRPLGYDDPELLKTVVLMTDGMNSSSSRIENWAYNSESEYRHWDRYNFWYYLNRYVRSYSRSQYYEQKYTASQGDGLLDNVCDAAKASGIVVWSIGFEVTDHGADVMENCASSPSHFFRVEGVEISDAFSAIARTINDLRLIQ